MRSYTVVMQDIPRRLYVAEQVRELDRRAIAGGTPGYVLMQRAAAACWRAIVDGGGIPRRLVVVCGGGNNGGDGYEIARLARAAGASTFACAVTQPAEGTDAMTAYRAWLADGGTVDALPTALPACDWAVDALLGTGLSRAPEGVMAEAIRGLNVLRSTGARVLAADVPSGLDASCGHTPGVCVQADVTVSFIGNKLGLWTGRGPEVSGARIFDALDVLPEIYTDLPPVALLQDVADLRALGRRPRDAYKTRFGHVLVIGGNHGMGGAALLSARAALRAGAGLVSVATRAQHASALLSAQPELMVHVAETPEALEALLEKATHIALGPGLGQDEWARAMFARIVTAEHPTVIDADALNLLARLPRRRDDWILTPHPGEAARLLQSTIQDVQADRLSAVAALQARYGGVAILKGAGTLISTAPASVCAYGNPGMAVAGMGDVLTGTVAALWGQGLPAADAARCGVLVHAYAGDRAAAAGERGMIPGDLIAELRGVVNPS